MKDKNSGSKSEKSQNLTKDAVSSKENNQSAPKNIIPDEVPRQDGPGGE